MFVPADAVPSAFVGLGRHSFFRGHESFSWYSEPSLPNPDTLSLASQGTGPRLPLDCVAVVPCISKND
jgi:hypothetical protein